MKSNENEITTHLNGSFAVPFTMTIKTIVISHQDCLDGEWNALLTKTSDEYFMISDCQGNAKMMYTVGFRAQLHTFIGVRNVK